MIVYNVTLLGSYRTKTALTLRFISAGAVKTFVKSAIISDDLYNWIVLVYEDDFNVRSFANGPDYSAGYGDSIESVY